MIYVVSGLPRSGTSLMMQMLNAGGLEVCTDGLRKPDDDNPRGYYEDERVKRLEKDSSWIPEAEGKLIKVISMLLTSLPRDRSYKIVFMERDPDEILRSQHKMLARCGVGEQGPDDVKMRKFYERHLRDIRAYLKRNDCFDVLYCPYRDAVADPRETVEKLCAFLDSPLDREAMIAAVDPSLYRNRSK